jgi:hypothetical protein
VETFTYQLSVTDDCALLLKESLTIYVNGTDKAGSPLTEEHAVDLTSSGDQSFSIANFKGSESLSITLMGISSYAIEGATPSKEPVPLASLTPYYAGTQAVITFVTSTVDYTTSTLSYSISVTDPSSVLDTTSVYLIAANSDSGASRKKEPSAGSHHGHPDLEPEFVHQREFPSLGHLGDLLLCQRRGYCA